MLPDFVEAWAETPKELGARLSSAGLPIMMSPSSFKIVLAAGSEEAPDVPVGEEQVQAETMRLVNFGKRWAGLGIQKKGLSYLQKYGGRDRAFSTPEGFPYGGKCISNGILCCRYHTS